MAVSLKELTKAMVFAGVLFLVTLEVACGGGSGGGPVIIVDGGADTNVRDEAVTLREAILLAVGELAVADLVPAEADNVSGAPGPDSADTITFDTLVFLPSLSVTISLQGSLPSLAGGGDTIDASQAGVIVDGGDRSFECFSVDSAGNALQGLQIQNCLKGIALGSGAQGNTIGGEAEGEGNIISANEEGVLIAGVGADGNAIKGSFIGTDAAGTKALGNSTGIHIGSGAQGNVVGGASPGARNVISGNEIQGIIIRGRSNVVVGNYIGTDVTGKVSIPNGAEGIWIADAALDNIIGGATPAERNVISGNGLFGMNISGSRATGNIVKGNYIGVDATGKVALWNPYGLAIDGAANNIIGGTAPGEGNVISGNGTGVLIRGSGASANVFKGNHIGAGSTLSRPLGNVLGIWILKGAHHNLIGGQDAGDGNIISFNQRQGLMIEGSDTLCNTIRGNSIYSSGGAGMENADGGNIELEAPTLTGISPVAGMACPNCVVDIYSDSEDEGEVYEGWTVVGEEGAFTFAKTVSGPNITATATDAEGNTSNFSQPVQVGAG
jgi:hypothetical protein